MPALHATSPRTCTNRASATTSGGGSDGGDCAASPAAGPGVALEEGHQREVGGGDRASLGVASAVCSAAVSVSRAVSNRPVSASS